MTPPPPAAAPPSRSLEAAALDDATFRGFQRLIYDEAGIALAESKRALVSARLAKRMRALGMRDYGRYLRLVRGGGSQAERVSMVDAICTNVTSFYRSPEHFEFIAADVQRRLRAGQRRLRYWCAGCSTGEEPYTLAMTLLEATRGADVDLRILATDLSSHALATARAGLYSQRKVGSVPDALLRRYFDRVEGPIEPAFRVRPAARSLVAIHRLNLSAPPFPMSGPFDAVLCRNVMIYFDDPVRRRLLDEVHRLVGDDGHLLVGHAECLTGLLSRFQSVQPSLYRKVG